MLDLDQERENLVVADRHITEGERRITEQLARIATLAEDGHDTAQAEHLLRTFEETLAEWHGHRQSILASIARLTAATP
ncbi:hypothetical protein [Methylobacterium nigriterrae]|uniref:hypothetical protein n=1 Tax=Methylobacterium nigriterrae TaxID=3127512 RepID=UPI003013DCC3